MPRATKTRRSITAGEALLSWLDRCASSRVPARWFVYLFPLQDCSSFKVGFTCNPLQRIATFNSRYFEYFDLRQSLLLSVSSNETAREVEANLKSEFAGYRCEPPDWVVFEAGGRTEWFGAVQAAAAENRLRSAAGRDENAVVETYDFIHGLLANVRLEFERWAFAQARLIEHDIESMRLGYAMSVSPQPLRDWFDAYRYFGIETFADDPEVRAFVATIANGVR